MNPEQTREAIRVMQHFADGKRIEFRWRDGDGTWWCPMTEPVWDWDSAEYRIAREPVRMWAVVDRTGYLARLPTSAEDAQFHAEHLNRYGDGAPYRVVEMVEADK